MVNLSICVLYQLYTAVTSRWAGNKVITDTFLGNSKRACLLPCGNMSEGDFAIGSRTGPQASRRGMVAYNQAGSKVNEEEGALFLQGAGAI